MVFRSLVLKGGLIVKGNDAIIYACVIIGAGIGLLFDNVFPGVLIGLGVGYFFKIVFPSKTND